MKITARAAAYQAVWTALKEEAFIADTLTQWVETAHPSKQDLNFAWEIANGSMRMALALDHFAKQCAERPKLSLKIKERALLYTALYQHIYMSRVPLYAIVDETVALAHRHCHSTFAGFLNAILRRLDRASLSLPVGDEPEALSVRSSFPPSFVKELIQDYGLMSAKQILEAENSPPPIMARIRNENSFKIENYPYLDLVQKDMVRLKENTQLEHLAKSEELYIQNITPAALIANLTESKINPHTILDLCASPGGKLLALHDRFPEATLYANDLSEEKLHRLKDNCRKYHLKVVFSCGRGEEYQGGPFDLILLDVPCSNSGVLYKRPEARWRLTDESLCALEKIQLRLIGRASQLIAPGGELWFTTCSILKRENERLIAQACQHYSLKIKNSCTFLPNLEGWEGGFGAILIKPS